MKFVYALLFVAALGMGSFLSAQEACGCCKAPDSIQSPHGGLLERAGHGHYVELLEENNEVRIYVYDKDIKPVDFSKYSLGAQLLVPKKDAAALVLIESEDHHLCKMTQLDQLHRYTVKVLLKIDNKDEIAEFVIER